MKTNCISKMGAYLGYPSKEYVNYIDKLKSQSAALHKRIEILEKRMYISEQNNMRVNEHLSDLEDRTESLEKTSDYVNTSITYMQHSIDELMDEQFSKK